MKFKDYVKESETKFWNEFIEKFNKTFGGRGRWI